MKVRISVPRALGLRARCLLHPGRSVGLFLLLLSLFVVATWNFKQSRPGSSGGWELALIAFGLASCWFWLALSREAASRGFEFSLAAAIVLAVGHIGFGFRLPEWDWLLILLAAVTGVLFGTRSGLLISALVFLLLAAGHRYADSPMGPFLQRLFLLGGAMTGAAALFGSLTANQRARMRGLTEELARAKATPFAFGAAGMQVSRISGEHDSDDPRSRLESLDSNLAAILERVKSYLRAHSVLLFLPEGSGGLSIRHALSDSPHLDMEHRLDASESLLGRIFSRGIACNWNLEDPDCRISASEISYYRIPESVVHIAACPLLDGGRQHGLLVVDRKGSIPFHEIELLHLETFAIQFVEIIQLGRRYLEQVDRNMEHRLFYSAMQELETSLAPEEMAEALDRASMRIVSASQFIVALLDESGLQYEIVHARGAEELLGTKQRCRGRTWIGWMLQSDSPPLLLRDIRSHVSRMPVASPAESPVPVRSVIMLPLRAKQRRLGLAFMGSEAADIYQNWQLRILMMLCNLAASAIENALLHRRVEEEAVSDGLTRLKNHRFFQERLGSECSRARRSKTALSLLMIDIDHFKRINDTCGHRVGDAVLQQMGTILGNAVRSEDSVARYGGEEFAVLLTDSNRKGALRMAERTRRAVEKAVFQADEREIRITVSIGTATIPDDAAESWQLLERSDQALYAAKTLGRNRVVQYHTLAATEPKVQNG